MGKLNGGVEPSRRGGARPGAGRKPSEFLEKCRNISSSPKFMKWAEAVLNGDKVETKMSIDGTEFKIPASTGDRVYLWEKLAAYGFGKPMQAVELYGEGGGPLKIELVNYANPS